jgi:hypothetical protein
MTREWMLMRGKMRRNDHSKFVYGEMIDKQKRLQLLKTFTSKNVQ